MTSQTINTIAGGPFGLPQPVSARLCGHLNTAHTWTHLFFFLLLEDFLCLVQCVSQKTPSSREVYLLLPIWTSACSPGPPWCWLGSGGAGILSDGSGKRPLVSPKCPWRKEVQLPSGRERLLGPRKKEYSGRPRGNQGPSWRNCCCRQVPQGRAAPHFLRQALQQPRCLPWIQSSRTLVCPEP